VIDKDTNTNIIVDDILSWEKSLLHGVPAVICQVQNLLLSLKKSHIFPRCFKFVGIDICPKGNHPTMLKLQLLEHWPTPISACNVAKFMGFMQVYSLFIPNFEI
jgi:hypothetical protein